MPDDIDFRARVRNGLQHLRLNQGVQQQHKLWSKAGQQRLQQLPLEGWAGVRRDDSLILREQLDRLIAPPESDFADDPTWVGPMTSLAFAPTLGDVSRFKSSNKKVVSYLGLIPSAHSSGTKRRLGAITKQCNSFMRILLIEPAQSATRHDQGVSTRVFGTAATTSRRVEVKLQGEFVSVHSPQDEALLEKFIRALVCTFTMIAAFLFRRL